MGDHGATDDALVRLVSGLERNGILVFHGSSVCDPE